MSDGIFEILAMVTIIFAYLFGYSSGKHYGRIEGEDKYRREHEHNAETNRRTLNDIKSGKGLSPIETEED